jgi:hypothetical protein
MNVTPLRRTILTVLAGCWLLVVVSAQEVALPIRANSVKFAVIQRRQSDRASVSGYSSVTHPSLALFTRPCRTRVDFWPL